MMRHVLLLLSVLVIVELSLCKDTLVMSYFRKVDSDGRFVHREDPGYDGKLPKPFVTKINQNDARSGALIKLMPSTVDNGGNVTVVWAGVENPSEDDFITFYCPGDDKPAHYLDYFHVNVDKNWSRGFGSHMVYVYNMRTTCKFKYFRHGNVSQLVAVSDELAFTNGSMAPLQGHLALTGNPTEMRISWVIGSPNANVLVRYGKTIAVEKSQSRHNVTTYGTQQLCGVPANETGFWHPGYIYDVLLTDLQPNTKYYYTYGNGTIMSPVHTFTTAIPAGDRTPYQAIVYGDMGIDPYPQGKTTAKHVLNEILTNDYRFILHHGDISYALGHSYIWEQWFALVEPFATRVPYMVGIGNHEYDHESGGEHDPSGAPKQGYHPIWGNMDNDSHGECGVPMYHRFHMPETGYKLWWYSYDYGMVHYVMMSTEHDFSPGSKQYNWMQSDLSNVDREKTPWVIFAGHRPMYSSIPAPDDYVVSINMQRLFEDLLFSSKVDLALWAHYHSYERTCKLYKQQCRDDGFVNIVVGTAGRSLDPAIWFHKPWSIYRNANYGYGRLHVVNSTAMLWEWVENSSGKVSDTAWITK